MFSHEALLYEGPDGFLAGTLPFIREGLERYVEWARGEQDALELPRTQPVRNW